MNPDNFDQIKSLMQEREKLKTLLAKLGNGKSIIKSVTVQFVVGMVDVSSEDVAWQKNSVNLLEEYNDAIRARIKGKIQLIENKLSAL